MDIFSSIVLSGHHVFKMCGLLLVIGATHGLIEGIKNRNALISL